MARLLSCTLSNSKCPEKPLPRPLGLTTAHSGSSLQVGFSLNSRAQSPLYLSLHLSSAGLWWLPREWC